MPRLELRFLDNKVLRAVLLAGGIALFMWLGVTSYQQKSITFDEEHHILRGWVPLKTGDLIFNQYHPPLVNMISALPLALNPKYQIPTDFQDFRGDMQKLFSFFFLWKMGYDAEEIVNSCRFMIMVLGALLCLTVYFWSKALYGHKAGLFAFFLCILSPNIMAHSRLVTTDLGVTFFLFLATFCLYLWFQKKESKLRFVIAGVTLGLAQLSKFSAVMLFPAYFIALFADEFIHASDREKSLGKRLGLAVLKAAGQYALMLLICFAVVTAGYGFHPNSFFEKLFRHGGKVVFQPQTHYFHGQIVEGKIWYLPLVAILIKTPIPILIFAFWGEILSFFKKTPAREWLTLCLIPVLFLLVGLLPEKNSQLRYYLPIYPFLFVIGSKIITVAGALWKKALILLLSVWLIINQWMIYPDYLTFFNESVGGPKNGYKWLLDSNYDWGQDLKGLKKFIDEQGIGEISLSYFGRGFADYYDIKYQVLPSSFLSTLAWYEDTGKLPVPKGWVAVSANHLMGYYLMPKYRNFYAGLRKIEPTARIGNSIFVYHLVPKRGDRS